MLDTNIVLHWMRGKNAASKLLAEYGLGSRRPRPILPIVVKAEIKSLELQNVGREIERQTHRDSRGRQWQVAIVPTHLADQEDARFWWEELTAEERVVAVETCLASALRARGITNVPRLRRTARVVKRSGR